MTINILFLGSQEDWHHYKAVLRSALADIGCDVALSVETQTPNTVDFIICNPCFGLQDFSAFTGLKAIFGLWAGVDTLISNPTITVPIVRMVENSLTAGMVEWVLAHVLRHHLETDRYVAQQNRDWCPYTPPLAKDRRVSVLGFGQLGQAIAHALAYLNFHVSAWSRTPRNHVIAGIEHFSGQDQLIHAVDNHDIIIFILPLTVETTDLANDHFFAMLKTGTTLINAGRGGLINETALLRALDNGTVAHATLDVFTIEPLPAEHIFWRHAQVTVSPHIASCTRPETAAQAIAQNILRYKQGRALMHCVEKQRGY